MAPAPAGASQGWTVAVGEVYRVRTQELVAFDHSYW